MDSIVTSAKGAFSKKDDKKKVSSKKDEKTHEKNDSKDKKHHKDSKKSDSKKDLKTTKDHNNKKDAKSAVPAAVSIKNATAAVPEVPAPVEEKATTIIPSLSSFFSSWSKPGPHPAYVATTVDAKKTEEPKKADSKK